MGFLDFFKKIFRRNQPKMLNEGNAINGQYSQHPQQSGVLNEKVELYYNPQPHTIDAAIEQYVNSIIFRNEQGLSYDSYASLVSMCGLDNQYAGNNLQNERNLLNYLNNSRANDFKVVSDGNFHHVRTSHFPGVIDNRIYINCKRENIAKLATNLIQELNGNEYYFKFNADAQADRMRRSEQFVFYTSSDPNDMQKIVNAVRNVRQKNPELFRDSEAINPFMKNIDGYIAYAPDVSGQYQNLNGGIYPITKSYNSLLSTALEDSLLASIKEIVSRDIYLTTKMDGRVYNYPMPYVQNVLSDIRKNPNYMTKLVAQMKKNLTIASQKNPELQIKGIEKETTKNKEYYE